MNFFPKIGFFLVLVLGSPLFTTAQLKGEFGAGLGWTFNSNDGLLPDTAVRAPLRFIFQGGMHYGFNEHWGLGLDLSTSVFQRLDLFALVTTSELEDGTKVVDPQRTYSSIIALKPTYTFEWKGFDPYLAIGLGYNFLETRTVVDSDGDLRTEDNQSISVVPEVGLGIGDFSVALKVVLGVPLEAIDALDRNGNPVVMPENRLLFFYITGNYRFNISKN